MERCASILGILLIGFAAFFMVSDRQGKMQRQSREADRSVEELGDKLKEAWAGHHTP